MKHSIHISDVAAFLQCRRAWSWSSNLRQHLTTVKLYEPFYFGTVVHKLLEYRYSNRGIVQAATDLEAQPNAIKEFIDFGFQLVDHYITWQKDDHSDLGDENLHFISTEEDFCVPIYTPHGNKSNRYQFCGTVDGVIRSRIDNRLYLHEIKTTKSIDSRINQLALEMQPTAYLLAMQEKYGETFGGVIYTLIRKKLPESPDVLKNGLLSKNKAIDTTPEHFIRCIREHHVDIGNSAIKTVYGDVLQELLNKPNKFFRRILVKRTQTELDQMKRMLYDIARDMTRRDLPLYMSPSYFCNDCLFREPCLMQSRGESIDDFLSTHYTKNTRLDKVAA